MPANLKIHIDRLTVLQDKLQALSFHITHVENNGKATGEAIALLEQWSKVKAVIERLTFLNLGIDTSQAAIKEGVSEWVDKSKLELIKARLERDLAKVDKETKSALRIEKNAVASLESIEVERKSGKKAEPEKKVEKAAAEKKAVVEKKVVAAKSVEKVSAKVKVEAEKIDSKKNEAIKSINSRIDQMGTVAYDIMLKSIEGTFDFKNGKIVGDQNFVKQLNKLTIDVLDLLQSEPKFTGPVSQFVKRMQPISDAITDFQKGVNNVKVPDFEVAKKIVIEEVIDKMLNNGINQKFVIPMRDLIYRNATGGLSLSDARIQIKEFISGGKDTSGKLGQYVEQTAIQAVDAYSGAINQKLLETFDYDGQLITGSLIDNSSPQCRYAIEKLGGKITRENWKEVKAIGDKHGLIEGTTFDNLPTNKLHWGCRHNFFPIILKKTA